MKILKLLNILFWLSTAVTVVTPITRAVCTLWLHRGPQWPWWIWLEIQFASLILMIAIDLLKTARLNWLVRETRREVREALSRLETHGR